MRFTDAEVAEWVRATVSYAREFEMGEQLTAALEREAVSPAKGTED